jgi:hypothetical protein
MNIDLFEIIIFNVVRHAYFLKKKGAHRLGVQRFLNAS